LQVCALSDAQSQIDGANAAIDLALESGADTILMDDREGRLLDVRRKMPVTGTLGVLEKAYDLGLVADLAGTLARLESSGFYLSGRLRDSLLARDRKPRLRT
jgi:predicted nucleic acid-binding protein